MVTAIGILADSKQQGPPFSPVLLPGLRVWYDAQDSGTIAVNAGTVTQWNDKSVNGFHVAQATVPNQPTVNAAGINGRQTLSFNGTSQFLFVPAPVQIVNPISGDWSSYAVVKTQSITGTRTIIDQDIVSGTTQRCGIYLRSNNAVCQAVAFSTAGIAYIDTQAGLTVGSINYLSGVRVPTLVEVWRNGVSTAGGVAAGGTPQTSGNHSVTIGANQTATIAQFFWQGEIGEVLVYDVAHDTATRVQMENYLKAKWGL